MLKGRVTISSIISIMLIAQSLDDLLSWRSPIPKKAYILTLVTTRTTLPAAAVQLSHGQCMSRCKVHISLSCHQLNFFAGVHVDHLAERSSSSSSWMQGHLKARIYLKACPNENICFTSTYHRIMVLENTHRCISCYLW